MRHADKIKRMPFDSDKKPAIVLLSGGLDSATVLAKAVADGYSVTTLAFEYGQRHRIEIEAAARISEVMGAQDHRVVAIDLRSIGGSALTSDVGVPKGRDLTHPEHVIPVTYVPARNTIFLSYALGCAEVLHARDIFIGVNALDYSGYPDCRPEYLRAFQTMANLATREGVEGRGVTIHAPLLHMTKAEIIRLGLSLGVEYGLTTSCYDPDPQGRPCGACDACQLRAKGFAEVGVPDPRASATDR
jgi:7-cyano-7-deazaguanine synthase